jgi:ribosomal protein S8
MNFFHCPIRIEENRHKCPHLQNSEEVKEPGIEFFLEKKEIPSVFFY